LNDRSNKHGEPQPVGEALERGRRGQPVQMERGRAPGNPAARHDGSIGTPPSRSAHSRLGGSNPCRRRRTHAPSDRRIGADPPTRGSHSHSPGSGHLARPQFPRRAVQHVRMNAAVQCPWWSTCQGSPSRVQAENTSTGRPQVLSLQSITSPSRRRRMHVLSSISLWPQYRGNKVQSYHSPPLCSPSYSASLSSLHHVTLKVVLWQYLKNACTHKSSSANLQRICYYARFTSRAGITTKGYARVLAHRARK
jgi:hypothetical protein